jgi:hypothetical protein
MSHHSLKPVLLRRAMAAMLISGLAGCQTPAPAAVPAQMQSEQTTQACIAQMQDAVAAATGSKTVLTRLAFAGSDSLTITRTELTNAAGLPLDGRSKELPEAFRLQLASANRCEIVHQRSGKSAVLDACGCTAMK